MPARRWWRIARIAWAVVLVASVARVLVSGSTSHQGVYAIVYWQSGRNWLEGRSLYPARYDGVASPYSPLAAAVLAPFSFLPVTWGNAAWRLFLGAGYLVALSWWIRTCLPGGTSPAKPQAARPSPADDRWEHALVFLLVVPLAATNLINGQAGMLVCSLVLLAVAAAQRERWFLAGLCGMLAAAFKVYPVALLLLLAVCYPRRAVVPFAMAAVAVLLLPFVLQSPAYVAGQLADWPRFLRSADAHPWYHGLYNRDCRLLYTLIGLAVTPACYRVQELLFSGGIACLCLAARRAGWPRRDVLALVLGLATCWMTVFGPAVESFGYALVAPTLASVVVRSTWPGGHRGFRLAMGASWVLFTAVTVSVWFPGGASLGRLGLHPLAGMVLFGGLVHQCLARLRRVRAGSGVPPAGLPAAA